MKEKALLMKRTVYLLVILSLRTLDWLFKNERALQSAPMTENKRTTSHLCL